MATKFFLSLSAKKDSFVDVAANKPYYRVQLWISNWKKSKPPLYFPSLFGRLPPKCNPGKSK
jgi:hypothetical protein